ncbi:LacI family DNA-binding transcriptional regulator [Trueperella pyogenes]|uniref:LacI family DNA-binding transcriptional regulator n=1 Tax=Trueperella pyogenes TaxID=1661 RepID=UPI00345DE7F7
MAKRALMKDVAQLAGVSLQTVSRVIRNHPAVAPQTRDRVQTAIKELDYHPDISAQNLATGRSRSIGVITIGRLQHGMRSTFAALETSVRSHGRFILSASASEDDPESISDAFGYLHGQGVIATIVIVQNPAVLPHISQARPGPGVLVIGGGHRLAGLSVVTFDHGAGARAATKHLASAGEIFHVAGPLDAQDAVDRLLAFQNECKSSGILAHWKSAGAWNARSGYELGRLVLAQGVPPAVFAANDYLAIGYARALAEVGKRAGRDYRLVGFDDIPVAAYVDPSLSSIRQDYGLLAEMIVEALDEAISGERGEPRLLDTELIIRESSSS